MRPDHDVAGATGLARLRELVRRHQICWESRPDYAVVGGATRPVGFVIEITATHDRPRHPPLAGCPECDAPLLALEQVIAFVVPKERRDSIHEVHVRWGVLQNDRRRGNRREVDATIHVLHAEGPDRPIDACEDRCRREIVGNLEALGACEGAWTPHGRPSTDAPA